MKRRNVLFFFGTRPEAIKMAPVVACLKADPDLNVRVAVSAQHRGMLDQVLKLFDVKSDADLNVMRPGQTLFDITARVLQGFAPVLEKFRPNIVLVHGDTTTSMAGSLASFYRQIPIGHVEAGLRTHDLSRPFPEEANRRITGVLTALHFSPTPESRRNLEREHVDPARIFVTGNTVTDALRITAERNRRIQSPAVRKAVAVIDRVGGKLILMTAHRRENFGRPFEEAFTAVRKLSIEFPDLHWIYPVHPNPNVLSVVKKKLHGRPNIHLVEPLDYCDIVALLKRAYLVVTDSGGLQEEAPSLGKPVLVLRDVTERPEAVKAGTVTLVGTSSKRIQTAVRRLIRDPRAYEKMANAVNPYGDGHASERIRQAIRWYFGLSRTRPKPFGKSR